MYFIATGTVVPSAEMDAHRPEEIRVFEQLRAEGVIRQVFRLASGPGVVNIVEAESLTEARTQLGRLPFVERGFLSFDLVEVIKVD